MAATINLNQTTAYCVHKISDIGQTTYQNVCTNTTDTLPWGSLDWLGFGLLVTAVVLVAGFLAVGLFVMICDY